jgi:hypothetical protein
LPSDAISISPSGSCAVSRSVKIYDGRHDRLRDQIEPNARSARLKVPDQPHTEMNGAKPPKIATASA